MSHTILAQRVERMNSTASGYDLLPRNFDSIHYIEVKWSRGPMPWTTVEDVVNDSQRYASGTFLVESNNLDFTARFLLQRHGGQELPLRYPR